MESSMDQILNDFLKKQREDTTQLADESDLLALTLLDDQRFIATFNCKGLVRESGGRVQVHDRFDVGIRLPDDYLRRVNPAEVLTWLGPKEIFHPNIRAPHICLGPIIPGTALTELLHRVFELITYQSVTMREDDAFDWDACAWARRNRERLPVDTRPIKRQATSARVEPTWAAQ
jgi:hypothetical protein